jgi:diketogulonate reductase-like aldo/keto reductase
VISFSPLANGNKQLINDPVLRQIARKYRKTPAQVAIRFQIQRGVIPIPKSTRPARMAENIDVFNFRLSSDDMRRINRLNRNLRVFPQRGGNNHQYYPFNDEF